MSLSGQSSSCADSRKCKYGYGCNTGNTCYCIIYITLVCSDKQCKTCNNNNTVNMCYSCWKTSTLWDKVNLNGMCPCKIFFYLVEFLDLRNINDISLDVPPAHHYRVTMDFWMFVNDPSKLLIGTNPSASNIIYTNFLSVSLSQSSPSTGINITCIPIEFIFTIKGKTTISAMNTLLSTFTNNPTILKDTVLSAANQWFFTRCAFSYQHSQAYINQIPITPLLIPKMYSAQTSFNIYFKKFFLSSQTVKFYMEGFANNNTPIYLRNLNVFREFLPQNLNLKYL